MQCTAADAFELFLEPWCDSSAKLVVVLNRGMDGAAACRIHEVSPGQHTVIVRSDDWNNKERLIDLSAATFSYEDSRAGLVPELVERKWSCFLLAEFEDGRSLLFALPRPEAVG